jgi:hypothetical protein
VKAVVSVFVAQCCHFEPDVPEVKDVAPQLLHFCLATLRDQFKSSDVDMTLLAASFSALSHLLTAFPSRSARDLDAVLAEQIVDYLRRALVRQTSTKRLDVPRGELAPSPVVFWRMLGSCATAAALGFLVRQAPTVAFALLQAHEYFFERLCEWCLHTNREIRRDAMRAIEVFLKVVRL